MKIARCALRNTASVGRIPSNHRLQRSNRSFRRGHYTALVGLGLSFLGEVAIAQNVRIPDPGSFQEFLRRRSPDLVAPTHELTPQHLLSVVPGDARVESLGADSTTGLVPPKSPFPRPLEKLPEDDPRTPQFKQQLIEFLENREKVLQLRSEYLKSVGERKRFFATTAAFDTASGYFAAKVSEWNGDIFWAPASNSTEVVIRAGDEARAVLGPIPKFDVKTLGKFTRADGWKIETAMLPLEVDGNIVELKPNTSKDGNPLEFEHRDVNGDFVKWTATIEKCDKPSLAGGVTPCGASSRISRAVKGNVEWLALARKTKGVERLAPEPYWMPSNSSYALLGYIGFNRVSGEVAFFDGSYEGIRFNWDAPTVQPGGEGYKDEAGRAASVSTYDATFRIDCAACHDNKKPRIITPYIKQARVGYRSEARANAFSVGELFPELPRGIRTPYRVVGSGYTAVNTNTLRNARSIVDPTRNCTSCHGLTNNGTARFASDSVGRLGSLSGDQNVENDFRTEWALRSGNGKIHPWMVPVDGNGLSADPPAQELSDTDWAKLKAALEQPDSDPSSLKLFTKVPAPESVLTEDTRIADPSAPSSFSVSVVNNRNGSNEPLPKEIRFSWLYLNSFGGVPERDDVRFQLAILETEIPEGGGDTPQNEFPSLEQAKGLGATHVAGEVYREGPIVILKDISFEQHLRWTDPPPATTPRQYRLAFPVQKDKRYLLRLVAKRFCFDQTEENYSNADHLFSVDVR